MPIPHPSLAPTSQSFHNTSTPTIATSPRLQPTLKPTIKSVSPSAHHSSHQSATPHTPYQPSSNPTQQPLNQSPNQPSHHPSNQPLSQLPPHPSGHTSNHPSRNPSLSCQASQAITPAFSHSVSPLPSHLASSHIGHQANHPPPPHHAIYPLWPLLAHTCRFQSFKMPLPRLPTSPRGYAQ